MTFLFCFCFVTEPEQLAGTYAKAIRNLYPGKIEVDQATAISVPR